MREDIINKVQIWFIKQIHNGIKVFDIEKCTYEIGLNPENKEDVQYVDEAFEIIANQINHIHDNCDVFNN